MLKPGRTAKDTKRNRGITTERAESTEFTEQSSFFLYALCVLRVLCVKSLLVSLRFFPASPSGSYVTATETRRALRMRRTSQRMPTGMRVQYALPITCPVMKLSDPNAR